MVLGLKIFSLNTWLLPFRISADNEQRCDKIIQYVKDQDYDIVCLQEVWLIKDVQKLQKHLPQYHGYWSEEKGFNKGGLVILSKLKGKARFRSFNHLSSHPFERIAHKGFLQVQLENGLNIVTTHLDAYKKQSAQLQLDELLAIQTPRTIICGDFNLESDELRLDHTRHSLLDTSAGIVASNPYSHRRLNSFRKEKNIDHLLFTKKLKVKGKTIKTKHFSDHLALEAELQ